MGIRPSHPSIHPSHPSNQPSHPSIQPSHPSNQPSHSSFQPSHATTQSSFATTQSTSPTSHLYETYQIPSVQDDNATKRYRISCRFSLHPSQSCATSVKYEK